MVRESLTDASGPNVSRHARTATIQLDHDPEHPSFRRKHPGRETLFNVALFSVLPTYRL